MQVRFPDIRFKFRFMRSGRPQSALARKGLATGDRLVLGKQVIPYDAIARTSLRDEHLALLLAPDAGRESKPLRKLAKDGQLRLAVSKGMAQAVKRQIDRARSLKQVAQRHAELAQAGMAEQFRAAACPGCHAALDLSGLDRTPYVHCPFCETVFKQDGTVATSGSHFLFCDECGMFHQVEAHTGRCYGVAFSLSGVLPEPQHLCSRCAARISRRILLSNPLVFFGLTFMVLLARNVTPKQDESQHQLTKANALAEKGRYTEAEPLYIDLLRGLPEHPGLLVNQGLAHLNGGDPMGAALLFRRALASCSNHSRARGLLELAERGTAKTTP